MTVAHLRRYLRQVSPLISDTDGDFSLGLGAAKIRQNICEIEVLLLYAVPRGISTFTVIHSYWISG